MTFRRRAPHALLGLSLLVVASSCARNPQAERGLDSFVGRDLTHADWKDREVFSTRLAALTGEPAEEPSLFSLDPFWVRRLDSTPPYWMVLEANPCRTIPGSSWARIHLFDPQWNRVRQQQFNAGYRCVLREAELTVDHPLQQSLLCIRVFRVRRGELPFDRDPANEIRQYYALVESTFVLVRIEDSTWSSLPNSYLGSVPNIGPSPKMRSKLEWIETLRSSDPARQLATLVWLSGFHLPSREPRYEQVSQEPAADSTAYEMVRDAPETCDAVSALTASANPWVAEYARIALESLR